MTLQKLVFPMTPRAVPFLRLLIPFALSLGIGGHYDWYAPWLGTMLVFCAPLLYYLAGWQFAYRYRWVYGLLFSIWWFGFGYYHLVDHNETRRPDHFAPQIQTVRYVVGSIYESPSRGAKRKVPLLVEAVGSSLDSLQRCSGHLLIFLDVTAQTDSLRYGDRLGIRTTVRPTESPKNPHAFDYRQYLHYQNIHFQAFVQTDSLIRLSTGHGHTLWRLAYSCRDRLLALLHRYFTTPDEYAVASALLVGYTDDLSEEVRTAYAETGSMHALAVSGTHVGMIYVGIMFLLGRLPLRGRRGKLVETVLALLGIWAFTFLTGATASVLRASVMFSLFLCGKLLFRNASIWNILAASAVGLLLYNPYMLFNVGFQLSYAAVAGMVFFYPQFNKKTPDWPRPLGEFRKIFLIGFAAQLGTLPLSLFYFHQFPVYFWLAGWVVVLGGAIFLAGGSLLVLLDAIAPWLADWCGWLLYYLVWGMNQVVFYIQHLPGSLISGIWLTGWAVVVLYTAIGFVGAAMITRRVRWVIVAMAMVTLLGICRLWRSYQQENQGQVVVYAISRQHLLDFFDGRVVVSLSDSLTRKQEMFSAQPNRWASGMCKKTSLILAGGTLFQSENCCFDPPFVQFFDQKMVILDNASWVEHGQPAPFPVDAIVLSNNIKVSIADCLRRFPCRLVIWDNTNSWKQGERWQAECKSLGITGYNLRQEGAYVWSVRSKK